MSHPDEAKLLASLPPPCRAALEAGFRLRDGRAQKHFTSALESIRYPKVGKPRVFPLASSLTRDQRLVAELLAYREEQVAPFALASSAANFRHWVDEDADDPLRYVVGGEPLWRALQIEGSGVFADVPVAVAIHALAMLWSDLGNVWYTHSFDKADRGWKAFELVHPRLRDEARSWITAYADQLVEQATWKSKTGGLRGLVKGRPPTWWIPVEVRWIVFVSLVRAGIAVDPRWDVFFPIEGSGRKKLTFECLKALPDVRRAPAILDALRSSGSHVYDVPGVLAVLRSVPSAELAKWVVDNADEAAGMTKREVLAAVAKVRSDATPARRILVLTYRKVRVRPSASNLEVTQRKQVEVAGREYDGYDAPASVRLASKQALFRKFLEVGELLRDGKAVFDVLLYMVDSGTIFHAGTTRLAASVLQGGVDCGDDALREAIEQALADRSRKRRRATKPKKRKPK